MTAETDVLDPDAPALTDAPLDWAAFDVLAGELAGVRFVKVVVDRETGSTHFLNTARWRFHVEYVAELLGMPRAELEARLDELNQRVYHDPQRRFYLGILSRHRHADGAANAAGAGFVSLETTEVDTMDLDMLRYFYRTVRDRVPAEIPLLVKPASHLQEMFLRDIPAEEVPRVLAHELFSQARFVPLNPGVARGRLRVFADEPAYRRAEAPRFSDIVLMPKVPDDVPRVAGMINTTHITPLSHTNVLAHGWQIPNAIALDAARRAAALDGQWVEYRVEPTAGDIELHPIEAPATLEHPVPVREPVWIDDPEPMHGTITPLHALRAADRYRYGTKAANLGELHHVLANGSHRLLGFYQVPRPPRGDLLDYLARQLGAGRDGVADAAQELLRRYVRIPRGIALPFGLQQRFLESSWQIQQVIGQLKMALRLDAEDMIDPLCRQLQDLIRRTRLPEDMRYSVDAAIVEHLAGARSLVVRSSSNAEDLAGFSAAGIYASVNRVTSTDAVLRAVREVWASLVSPRSVRLRQQAGISLDASYMGVVIQQEAAAELGGVLVTMNPMRADDFRSVYLNAARRSVDAVVSGSVAPLQYLYNTMEGGGRTVSLGDADADLSDVDKELLGRLALVGRLLQSHFAADYTFAEPLDVEWLAGEDTLTILQLRPYSH